MDFSYGPPDRVAPRVLKRVEMGNPTLSLALRRVDGTGPY